MILEEVLVLSLYEVLVQLLVDTLVAGQVLVLVVKSESGDNENFVL